MSNNNKTSKNIARNAFSAKQRIQAREAARISEIERHSRIGTVTYPIDNVGPEIISDRDDGIFVETNKLDRGYRVHITIADVAAHVPLGTPLSDVAHDRAFTVYRPWMTDHMFPSPLVERLSLEDKQDRLGLSVIIDLDEEYAPKHIEFAKVLTKSHSVDYAMAESMANDNHDFKIMSDIANKLKDNFFNEDNPAYHEMSKSVMSRPNIASSTLDAKKMVETYMLLANYAVASIFHKTDLPFLYRNFDGSYKGQKGDVERAYYSTECTEHNALPYKRIGESYCHFTSPIRRGPDFYNGHMVHYVIGVMQYIEDSIRENSTEIDQEKLHYELWQNVENILKHCSIGNKANNFIESKENLTSLIKDICKRISNTETNPDKLDSIADYILAIDIPLSKEQLESYASQINILNDHENELLNSIEVKKAIKLTDRQTEWEEKLLSFTPASLARKETKPFSALLSQAATTGILPEALYIEAEKRFKAVRNNPRSPKAEKQYEISLAEDALTILIEAEFPGDPAWYNLKKCVIKTIKHRPDIINNIFEMAEERGIFPPGTSHVTTTVLPSSLENSDIEDNVMHASYLTLLDKNKGEIPVAAPRFSVSHTRREAESHAKYFFLEHYAFGDLVPLSEVELPNMLYAELDRAGVSKEEVIRQMLREQGGGFFLSIREVKNKGENTEYIAIARARGGKLKDEIRTYGVSDDKEDAERKACRRMLADKLFNNAMCQADSHELYRYIVPEDSLENYAALNNYKLEFEHKEIKESPSKIRHQISVYLKDESGNIVASSTQQGHNTERARISACAKMINNLGISPAESMYGASWAEMPQIGGTSAREAKYNPII